MHNPFQKENTHRLVLMLHAIHPFLREDETEEGFCTKFNYGSIAECHRSLFSEKRIWWKNGSYFEDGWKFGLPAQLKPYFYLIGFKLNKGTEEDPHTIPSTLFDCRQENI